jgi:hypothetical protein
MLGWVGQRSSRKFICAIHFADMNTIVTDEIDPDRVEALCRAIVRAVLANYLDGPLTPARDAEALEALVRATAWMQRLDRSGGSGKEQKAP